MEFKENSTSKGKYEVTQEERRETWTGRLDFFLSSVGYAVGIGNIWRFPYLCYKNGGGSFLIPYITFMILGALPMFLLEYSVGQFSSNGPISVWKICPLMKGLGYAMVTVSAIFCIYFNVMMGYVLYFLYHSLSSVLPWSTCDNKWNTEFCYISQTSNTSTSNISSISGNITGDLKMSSSEEFWRYNVLQITSGIEDMGKIRLELLLCLFIFWFIVFLCLCKGIKVSGKIVYVTAIFPYIVLLIFLVRVVTLPGAMDGILFYVVPQWDKLLSTKVWGEAALQIFFSTSMGWGGLLTFASYNKLHDNMYRNAMIVPAVNCGTSIFAGFITFSILGFMALNKGTTVDKVLNQGPGLVFITYPEAISSFPISPFWAILFFLMLFTIGIDTQFGTMETVLSALTDEFPKLFRRRKVFLTGAICIIEFILGIPFVMQGGIYALQIVDWYCALFSVMLVCILENIIIGWIYGANRFYEDIELMIGRKPCIWWSICWKFITPVILAMMLVFNMTQITPVSYGTYQYPQWAIAVGWIIGMLSVIPIPIYMVIDLWNANGTVLQRIKQRSNPAPNWGPANMDSTVYAQSLPKQDTFSPHYTTNSTENQTMLKDIMNGNSRHQDDDYEDRNLFGMRKITYWEKYGVKRFPYRGRRTFTSLLYQSLDGGMIISNDVYGLTISQFEQMYKACLERRKTQ
ncbi:Sodium- and chloride-dependent neutral and basic amino acid transporter B(0+),Sodium- and chloride-dependent taurine transporter,Sodium-dependent noradrenaline transporter,Sodium-dependent proline transporter,Sodium-and chloride-dependent glycine transporter 1,Creatine transporter,Sodium- and chloride-dependent GABA transporter 3,Sodium- and chloride-dependent betaine transporter,Sodium- and chloride-dependent GABA transporter 2,Sodium-dependent dopamine transporter,Sodium- and chloride-dependent GABA tran|uniref:Transporter n=1 Tax=Mytilus coruscus TaxID=42192 RepID=A0A6J8DMK7_MYTCO|nr:Sodium- and chloride-dependent neutral and basic amino acid transporter B(0+),Sodium- and chloride-dependent taurine transporter,Sodium-dependent noradrenaline transporter,Sodium-dependent proline transporter,Sodium-and chloride-dependent glycine transporter 1,Creatine transporter,Sodium- and chloride-dependent GABA transporter 3,Sodium- and chloride-dependent betaine transporter,Sodium- and chloride-dependent GABA transporter 2,Sodium-dependent dopamine transporter,Sodium- and chloride-dependen